MMISRADLSLSLFCHLGFRNFQRFGKLIRAGGLFVTAADALDASNDFIDIHALYQCGNTLQIAVAASLIGDIFENIVFDFKLDGIGADTLCLIAEFHNFVFLSVTRSDLQLTYLYNGSVCQGQAILADRAHQQKPQFHRVKWRSHQYR